MGLKKLFIRLRECKPDRKNYQYKLKIRIDVDTKRYRFYILPTILYVPWIYRIPNVGLGAFEIKWLNFTIVLGEWVTRAAEKGE